MSRHASSELLSAYVDEELEISERQQVESHVGQCADCRQRLDGLRRVRSTLRGLEQLAPPPFLGAEIHSRVRREPLRRSLISRLEMRLGRVPQQSALAVTFATIFALVIILYLFVSSVERHDRQGLRVIVPPLTPPEVVEVLGRHFERLPEGGWCERGLEPYGEGVRRVAMSSPEGSRLLAALPGLEALVREDGRVILRDGEQVLELVPEPSP